MAEMQAALQAAFNAINRDYYGGELEKVIITVKESKKEGTLGTFCTAKDWIQNGIERHEINISANYIGQRTVHQTITTLMHEMVHLYNCQNSIQDTSRAGIYHNKKFKEAAEAHGLSIEFDDNIGWSLTTLKPDTEKWIDENINIKTFGVYKVVAEKQGKANKPKQSMRKLICPHCGNIARVTKDIRLICGECFNPDEEPIYMEAEN